MNRRERNASGQRAGLSDPPLAELVERVRAATRDARPLEIRGGGSKAFYGRVVRGAPLDVRGLRGIVAYEPSELVITARAGTPLIDIEAALAAEQQMLGFEPPHFAPGATVGGAVASGLSGPARPYHGALRDFVLGVELLDGRGELLTFGGQVMKNVAGFDVSRLIAGSLGTLGVIVQASLRVLPRPRRERTLEWRLSPPVAQARMLALARAPWPMTALCYDGEILRMRAAGSDEAVTDAVARLAPDVVADELDYWHALRDLRLPFFAGDERALWRLSLPPATPDPPKLGAVLHDWGGAQRWVRAPADDEILRAYSVAHGGHATCFGAAGAAIEAPFTPLAPPLCALMQRLKQALDPQGIFNPGRLYEWL